MAYLIFSLPIITLIKHTHWSRTIVATIAALALSIVAPASLADDDEEEDEIPFADADIFFELNDTDGDLGIHALIDGDAWKRLEIEDPRERRMLKIRVTGRLRRQGLTEIFFESAEPPFESDEPGVVTLTPEEFFRRFPPGVYEVEGMTLEGQELESEVELTHVMPAPPAPTVNGAGLAEECDLDALDYDAPVVSDPVIISWDAVTLSHPGEGFLDPRVPVEINNYEVVVEVLDADADAVLQVVLPPSETSMTLPAAFVALGNKFKYEVLAREESFNQTATENCFQTK